LKFFQHRRTGRASIVILAVTAAGVFGTGVPASAAATDGRHIQTFNCESSAAPDDITSLTVTYTISSNDETHKKVKFEEASWLTSPHRALNALRLDIETTQGNYQEASPPWGGSSTTRDDVSNLFIQTPADTESWPFGQGGLGKGSWNFSNTHSAKLRLRCYGLGAGNTPSDATHNDAVVLPIL
jgi:hypothetical protein